MAKRIKPITSAEPVSTEKFEAPSEEHVVVDCMVPCKINGQEYFGKVEVPKHVAETLVPMVQAKIRTDMQIFQGHSYLVEKVAGTLKITEGVTKVPGER